MGVIKQGILGGFSGAVANVVGSSWKGIAVIKAKPLSVANPRTAAQVGNRDQFSQSVLFAVAILVNTIKPLLDRIAVRQSGYNFFVSLNKALFSSTKLETPADLVISQGTVEPPNVSSVDYDPASNLLDISYSTSTSVGDALPTDEIYGCLYNETLNESISITENNARSAGDLSQPIPVTWLAGHTVYSWTAFRRADGSRASNTTYQIAVEA